MSSPAIKRPGNRLLACRIFEPPSKIAFPAVFAWMLVLQRRFLNLVSFWPEIASRKARPQSCQARWQVAMKRCSRSLSGEPSL